MLMQCDKHALPPFLSHHDELYPSKTINKNKPFSHQLLWSENFIAAAEKKQVTHIYKIVHIPYFACSSKSGVYFTVIVLVLVT